MTSSSIQKMLLAAAALGAASVEAVSLSARAFLESKLAAQAGSEQCTTYDMSKCKKVEKFLPKDYDWGDNVSDSDFTWDSCYIWLVAYMNGSKKHYNFQAKGGTDLKCFYIDNNVLTANQLDDNGENLWFYEKRKDSETYWWNMETWCKINGVYQLKMEAGKWSKDNTSANKNLEPHYIDATNGHGWEWAINASTGSHNDSSEEYHHYAKQDSMNVWFYVNP